MASFDYGSGLPSATQLPVPLRANSKVPLGPFSFPKSMGLSLTSQPFRPAAQVIGSPQNATNLAAAALPSNIMEQIAATMAAKAKPVVPVNPMQQWMQHPTNRTGSGSDRGGYTTSGREGAGSFGSRSSSASRREGGLY